MAKQNSAVRKQPNILFVMGDDIGWFNIGAYHRGIMAGRTPNLDRLAVHGFDEFFGYLYHLDAMENPADPTYPPELKDKVGPRNVFHLAGWRSDAVRRRCRKE